MAYLRPALRLGLCAALLTACSSSDSSPEPGSQDASVLDSASGPDAREDSPWDATLADGSDSSPDSPLDSPAPFDASSDGPADGGALPLGPIEGAIVHTGYSASDDSLPLEMIVPLLDELRSLGMNTIVLNQTRTKLSDAGCTGDASSFEWVAGFPDKLGAILDAAQARHMSVWVGVTQSTGTCSFPFLPPNAGLVQQDVATYMAQLYASYGAHPALAGWYIPDEPSQLPEGMDGYYYNITYELKQIAPSLSVMICPYLVGIAQSPATLAARAADFRSATGIDIQAWQDSVGADSVKLPGWSRGGYTVKDYFDALSSTLGDSLWADTELFNYGKPLFNPEGVTGGYRPASVSRIQSQLDATQAAAHRISWLPQYHMTSFGPAAGYSEAPRLSAAYRAQVGLGGHRLTARSYQWTTDPSDTYPDSQSTELLDQVPGDPKNPSDPAWTGVLGDSEVVLDLGAPQRIDWVGAHVLVRPDWSVYAPAEMHLSCSLDGSNFTPIADIVSPIVFGNFGPVDAEEYVLGNEAALGASDCQYLKVQFKNEYWTFIGELELVSQS